MRENDIDISHIDFNLDSIRINEKQMDSKDNENEANNFGKTKRPIQSAYKNIKEIKLFTDLLEWIFNSPATALASTPAIAQFFVPLLVHYSGQYDYINQYLEMHTSFRKDGD